MSKKSAFWDSLLGYVKTADTYVSDKAKRICGTETFRARMPQVFSDLIARIEVENLCTGVEATWQSSRR